MGGSGVREQGSKGCESKGEGVHQWTAAASSPMSRVIPTPTNSARCQDSKLQPSSSPLNSAGNLSSRSRRVSVDHET